MLHKIIEVALDVIVPLCEMMGIIVVAVSTVTAFVRYVRSLFHGGGLHDIAGKLAAGLALSLEFKMAAEILKTVLIKELSELIVLGAVIVLRALMSFLIRFEMRRSEGQPAPETVEE